MQIIFHGSNSQTFRPRIERFLDSGHDIAEVDGAISSQAAREAYSRADVVIGGRLDGTTPINPELALYQVEGAGYDGVDLSYLPDGAWLCNCFEHETAIAEYVMAALLSRHVPLAAADRDMRAGRWIHWAGGAAGLRSELGGSTIGILGYGRVGRTVAHRAKAFGCNIIAANRSPVADPLVDRYYGLEALREFMGAADAVICSLPLTDETRQLVGADLLSHMRGDAVLVNVGRGPVVDAQALFDALSKRQIAAAMIDTWYTYPAHYGDIAQPSELPFEDLDNIVMTPHMSGWTFGTVERRQRAMAENINRIAAGKPPKNVVRPASAYCR